MEKKLYEAVIEGNVESLLKLLQEDALILNRCIFTFLGDAFPCSTMLGHKKFVFALVQQKPELAKELVHHLFI